jgi:hypothetical protein
VVVGGADEREQRRWIALLCALGVLDRARARDIRDRPRRRIGCPARLPRRRPTPTRCAHRWLGCLARARLGGLWSYRARDRPGRSLVLQVAPSVWTAYRTDRPTGISPGTWRLIFAELLCWGVYGLHRSDPRLTVLGWTGVTASVLMLARARGLAQRRPVAPSTTPGSTP